MKNPIHESRYHLYRVHRGGSWYYFVERSQVSNRNYEKLSYRSINIGLRIVRNKVRMKRRKKNEKSS